MTRQILRYDSMSFHDLPGWQEDDHLAAFEAFRKSCVRVLKSVKSGHSSKKKSPDPGLLSACFHASELAKTNPDRTVAKTFFETHFKPHRINHSGREGLLTGYYEPVINGSRTKTAKFSAPIYRRPTVGMTAAVRSNSSTALPTRQQIETGALKNKKLELLYLESDVDVFFLQVQGSGRVRLQDGTKIRVTYDGKNGHPYSSIGQYLIDTKLFPAHRMSLEALSDWLKSDKKRGQRVMWQNKSYVFFREIKSQKDEGPLGVMQIPLSAGRSLAVDGGYHAIGTPVYVSSPKLRHATGDKGFHRLMIAQDVGSAIKGPERGDIYFGSGPRAGKVAGVTKHPGTYYVMLPAMTGGNVIVAGETSPRPVRQARR